MGTTGNKAGSTILFGVLTGLSILGAGAIMAESEMTFINIPLFLITLLVFGGGILFLCRKWVSRVSFFSAPLWVNIAFFDIVFAAIGGGGILLANSIGCDSSGFEEKEAVVERKITKTRHKTQTTGRRTYSSGAPYYEYYLEIRYPDGSRRELKPDYKIYKKASEGDTVCLKVGRGRLGMVVVDARTLRLKHPPHKRKGRVKFFGTHSGKDKRHSEERNNE
ncbi:MAG: hypothetical protein K2H15_01650 [Muribaculaceae bacterium]|nr:hypothetical protein [Muribaculaceae bacterium]